MKTSLLSSEMLAAFQARGGSVRKVEAGEGVGLTDRQWYAASQGRLDLNRVISGPSENELIEERHVASRDHLGRDIIVNGLGELVGSV